MTLKLDGSASNADPRWTAVENACIEEAVSRALKLTARLEITQPDGRKLTTEERQEFLRVNFREIAKATSIDNLVCAPPQILEQLAVLALVNNQNVKGILVQVIRCFMNLWAMPETNKYAMDLLMHMESTMQSNMKAFEKIERWKPLPNK